MAMKTSSGEMSAACWSALFRVKDGKISYGRVYADTARGRDVLEGREPRRYPKVILD